MRPALSRLLPLLRPRLPAAAADRGVVVRILVAMVWVPFQVTMSLFLATGAMFIFLAVGLLASPFVGTYYLGRRLRRRGRRPLPSLVTPRLVLTPLEPGDEAALLSHWSEPAVRRYLWDDRIVSPAEVRDAIAGSGRMFAERGVGLWAVRPAGGGELIGCAGFWHFHDPPELELVVSVATLRQRRGLGREVAVALLDYAFAELRWPAVQGSADEGNRASVALMRRIGMRPAGERPGASGRVLVYVATPRTARPG